MAQMFEEGATVRYPMVSILDSPDEPVLEWLRELTADRCLRRPDDR